ncbi:MAG: hypothetical protein RIQ60_1019 [Pseudomonadota bacterium]|jgi:hypothetical protein
MKPSDHVVMPQLSAAPAATAASSASSLRPGLEAAAELREARTDLVRSPNVRLSHLRRLDEQLTQQLETLAGAGPVAVKRRVVDLTRPGDLFTQAVLAVELREHARFDELLDLAEHELHIEQALASALGWTAGLPLQERMRQLLGSRNPVARRIALSACAMHRVDPGAVLLPSLQASDPALRAAAARTAASVGRVDVVDILLAGLDDPAQAPASKVMPLVTEVPADDDGPESEFPSTEVICFEDDDDEFAPVRNSRHDAEPRASSWPALPASGSPAFGEAQLRTDTRGWSAWAAVMLGDRGPALSTLQELALGDTPMAVHALPLYLRVCDLNDAHDVLRTLTRRGGATSRRRLIQGCGVVGDPLYLPWLMDMMTEDAWARLAGEAFSLITGADLVALDLVRRRPEGITTRPGEYLTDADPGRIDDVQLPWPDRHSVSAWWNAQQAHFRVGRRHFMGASPSQDRALDVLHNGFQRQRAAAAQWLALLRPSSKLFPVRAPVRRQKRWLTEQGG